MAHILLVDDDPEITAYLTDLLALDGHLCTACDTQAKAEDAWNQHLPDLAILDIDLPESNGASLAWTLHQAHPLVPILIFSARLDLWELEDLLDCGASKVLSKTTAMDIFRSTVRDLLAQGHVLNLAMGA